MIRTYAIGDVHGQLDMLRHAHERIARDRERTGDAAAPVVHLGDLTDRGPDSAGVLQYLLDGIAGGAPWQVIRGNHDRMFAGFMADPQHHDPMLRRDLEWLDKRLGGAQTLASYGIDRAAERPLAQVHAEAQRRVPQAHVDFLNALPLHVKRGPALFVHAGIRPGIPLAQQTEDDLVWIRAPFHEFTQPHPELVVHGHTPVEQVQHYGNRLNLDTGAGYGHPLSAVVLEDDTAWLLADDGRVRLAPSS